MFESPSEIPIRLDDVPDLELVKEVIGTVKRCTVYQWTTDGVYWGSRRRVFLEAQKLSSDAFHRCLCTSEEALRRFFIATGRLVKVEA